LNPKGTTWNTLQKWDTQLDTLTTKETHVPQNGRRRSTVNHLQRTASAADISNFTNFKVLRQVMANTVSRIQDEVVTCIEAGLRGVQKELTQIHNRVAWVDLTHHSHVRQHFTKKLTFLRGPYFLKADHQHPTKPDLFPEETDSPSAYKTITMGTFQGSFAAIPAIQAAPHWAPSR